MINEDKVEFDVLINGEPAKRSLNDIKNELGKVQAQDEKTGKAISSNWAKIGAAVALATAAVAKATMESVKLERATFGLTAATKDYVKWASEQYGINQDIIAGFVQTGKTAGMSGKEIEKMIEQAVALGRAYPHESTETFIDNLTMLNRTGEAQGFIVDVLETKYGTMDLKALSLAEKMKAVDEATAGVNEKFEATRAAKIDRIIQEITNSVSDFGDTVLDAADDSGALWAFNKIIGLMSISINGLSLMVNRAKSVIKGFFGQDTAQEAEDYKKIVEDINSEWDKVLGKTKEQPDEPVKPKPTITGVEGKTKPITQKEIEDEIKLRQEAAKEKARLEAEEAAALRELEREKQRLAQQTADMQDKFADDYISSLTTDKQQELVILGEKYLEYEKYITDKSKLDEWYDNQVQQILKDDEKATDEYKKLKEETFDALTDSFVTFAQTGKLSFRSMAQSIIADLMRIKVQQMLVGAMTGTSFGGFFGFHTGTSEVKHSGGHIGRVPSYHSGMRSDERMAKLQVGEAVINRAGAANNATAIDAMNRGQKIGGGGNVTTAEITFNVTATDAQSFDRYLVSHKSTIESIITNSLERNGTVRQTIKQVI